MSQVHQAHGNTASQTPVLRQWTEGAWFALGGWREMLKQQNTEVQSMLAEPSFLTTPI